MMIPSFGWLDLSDTEQWRAREYLRQFRVEGTIDELGFGIVRDALADIFFPATNTIMTHTRYLFFVAASFLRIERERLSGAKAAKRLKELEDSLRQILTPAGSGAASEARLRGVIGASAKDDLQRYPSSIYWNSIKRLGLFLRPRWGLTYYLDHLADHYKAITPRRDDDGLSHLVVAEMPNWDPRLEEVLNSSAAVSEDLEFLPDLDFELSLKEARYLKDRFQALADAKGASLLAHLLEESCDVEFSYPWEVVAPDLLRPLVKHAQSFSMFTKGATLQYYDLLLAEQRATGLTVSVDSFEKPFAEWFSLTREHLATWDVEAFIHSLEGKCRLRPSDKQFLREWLMLCRDAKDGKTLLRDTRARGSVEQRESAVRPLKHRLGQEKYLRQWPSPESLDGQWYADPNHLPYLLNYRSDIGGDFVRDIVAGLRKKV
jgi:hypothetical protein